MRINQNIAAFNAYRNLNQTQNSLSSSLEKLSSGFRINRAADDASGLVNSENLRAQIGGLKVATRNAQDAISMVQTAEGAMTEVHSALQRMRDLVVEAGNIAPNDATSLQASQDEINQLANELDRIGEQTQFGTKKILDGSFDASAAQAAASAVTTAAVTGTGVTATAGLGTASSGTQADLTLDLAGTAFSDIQVSANVGREFTFTVTDSGAGDDIEVAVTIGENADATAANLRDALGDADGFTVTGTGTDVVITADAVEVGQTLGLTAGAEEVEEFVAADAMFQVGANSGQTVDVTIQSVKADGLGLTAGSLFSSVAQLNSEIGSGLDADNLSASIDDALLVLDEAVEDVSSQRAELGAFQNRMESTIRNVNVAVENLSAAESRIRDTDMASEMMEFTRNQILSQAGTAMMAQANMIPQSVLSLLG